MKAKLNKLIRVIYIYSLSKVIEQCHLTRQIYHVSTGPSDKAMIVTNQCLAILELITKENLEDELRKKTNEDERENRGNQGETN